MTYSNISSAFSLMEQLAEPRLASWPAWQEGQFQVVYSVNLSSLPDPLTGNQETLCVPNVTLLAISYFPQAV